MLCVSEDEISEIVNLREITGRYVFEEGEFFYSYEELRERLDMHSKENFVYYWRRDSRLAEHAFTKTSRHIATELKYYIVRFACIFGRKRNLGKKSKSTKTYTNCPAYIQLNASKCGKKLQVVSVCNYHNHEISEKISQLLPHNRRMSIILKEEVKELLRLKVDRSKIIDYVKQRENKVITSKDLFNLRIAKRKERESSVDSPEEIQKRLEILYKIESCTKDDTIKTIVTNAIIIYESKQQSELDLFSTNDTVDFNVSCESNTNGNIIDPVLEKTAKFENHTENLNHGNRSEITNETPEKYFSDLAISYLDYTDLLNIGESDIIQIENEIAKTPSYINEDKSIGPCENVLDQDNNVNEIISWSESNSTEKHQLEDNLNKKTLDKTDSVHFVEDHSNIESTIKNTVSDSTLMNTKTLTNKSLLGVNVNKSMKRLVKCRKCRTPAKLLLKQIQYLKAKKNKFLEETHVLRLKKMKLELEIKELKDMQTDMNCFM